MTLVVDDDAVPGHLGHGDTLGPCEKDAATDDDGASLDYGAADDDESHPPRR